MPENDAAEKLLREGIIAPGGNRNYLLINRHGLKSMPQLNEYLVSELMRVFLNIRVWGIVTPEGNGTILGKYATDYHYQETGQKIHHFVAEKNANGIFAFSDSDHLIMHSEGSLKTILVLDDVIKTGKTVEKLSALLSAYQAIIYSVAVIFNCLNKDPLDYRIFGKLEALINVVTNNSEVIDE